MITVFGKIVASHVMHVDDLPSSIWDGFATLFVNTDRSAAQSIWFLVVIFVYCAVTPLLVRLSGGRIWPWLILATPLVFIDVPAQLYADRMARFYVFFLAGRLVGRHHGWAMTVIKQYCAAFLLIFAASFALAPLDLPRTVKLFVIRFASLPALHAFVSTPPLSGSRLLLTLGGFSFSIYLLNTIAIGVAKGLLLKVLPWGGPAFVLVAPVLFLVGVLVPIAITILVLRRVPLLDRMTS